MRNGFIQTLLSLLLAAVILAGGWLGIRSLELVLPSGTDGHQLHDMASLNEEIFQAALTPEPIPPFTADGFPPHAQAVDESSPEYAAYMAILENMNYFDGTSVAVTSIISSNLQSIADANEGSEFYESDQQLRAYRDDRGLWVLAQTTIQAGASTYRFQVAFHSADGLRLIQLVSDTGNNTRLSPDDALMDRAASICGQFLGYWQEYSKALESKGTPEPGIYLDDDTFFSMKVAIPLSTDTPAKTELAGSQCRIYYPAQDGQIIMIYDFIGMRITGMAFIPDT